jgi:hypothetical protein
LRGGRCGEGINSYQLRLRLHSFAPFTVGEVLSKGGFSLIKLSTTVTFVTPHCFGGRYDDSRIVNDEREGLDMDGKERERGSRRRGERERRKGKK